MATRPPNIPQYDLPQREIELLKNQATQRAQRRHEFMKMNTNPFRGSGYTFDPALQRYIALKTSQYEYFKKTPKTTLWGIGVCVLPIVVFGYFVQKERLENEHQYRTGQVAYKDRLFKFI